MADDQLQVIGYHGQEKNVQSPREYEKLHLADSVWTHYNFALCLDAQQHLGDGGGGEAEVHKGQMGEEEVHGCVQVGVWADSQGEEQVPKHSDQVYGEENPK